MSDVLGELFEDDDDAGVVRPDAQPEQDGARQLPPEAGRELRREHRRRVGQQHGRGELRGAAAEPVQRGPEAQPGEGAAGAHRAEQQAGLLRADGKLRLRSVCDEGVGCKYS